MQALLKIINCIKKKTPDKQNKSDAKIQRKR